MIMGIFLLRVLLYCILVFFVNAQSFASCDQIDWNSKSCGAGYYNVCQTNRACPPSQYWNIPCTYSYSQACYPCSAGSWNPASSGANLKWDCVNCESGKSSPAASSSCTSCSAGTYSGSANPSCTSCVVGKYSTATAATVCANCAIGKYSQTGSSSCITCTVTIGTLCVDPVILSSCSKGEYYDVNAKICTKCAAGKYSNWERGQRIVTSSELSGTMFTCYECPGGLYQDEEGAGSCKFCTIGYSTGNVKETTRNCNLHASYSNAYINRPDFLCWYSTNSNCKCLMGTYSVRIDGNSPQTCFQCPDGSYAPEFGLCHGCPAGMFAQSAIINGNKLSAIDCTACPMGTYQPITGQSSESSCLKCEAGKYSDNIGVTSDAVCVGCDRQGVSIQGATSPSECSCGWGRYGTYGGCVTCPINTYSTELQAVYISTCVKCETGKFSNDEGHSSCSLCEVGFYGISEGGCLECPSGYYSDTRGAITCKTCEACPDGQYRTGCSLVSGTKTGGYCVDCPQCPNGQVRVGCMNNAGNSDKQGKCIQRDQLVQAPVCPRVTIYSDRESGEMKETFKEQVGLGGYTFRDVFGFEDRAAPFQCRRLCTGEARTGLSSDVASEPPGMRDQGTCAGPFACNIPACSMRSSDDSTKVDFRVPQACPVSLDDAEASSDVWQVMRRQTCQTCEKCGEPAANANNLADFGRGCAGECSRLVCPVGQIFDWTDGFHMYDAGASDLSLVQRCKPCDSLRDYRLCPAVSSTYSLADFAASDVSGNRLLMRFDGCNAKKDSGNSDITYGTCKQCHAREFECAADSSIDTYPSQCSGDEVQGGKWKCDRCMSRGSSVSVRLGKGSYYDTAIIVHALFCQVSCVDGWTGVQDENKLTPAVCARPCGESKACSDDSFAMGCSAPHDHRCVPRLPRLGIDDARRVTGMMPAHTNLLESVDSSTLFSNFENAFINLRADTHDLHQCVWNVIDVRDNDKTPGGVSYTFWPPAASYAFPLTKLGSKWCHWSQNLIVADGKAWKDGSFKRNADTMYPLLPLQNIVNSGDDPRRLLMNTSARVMRYCESIAADGQCVGGYSGQGESGIDAQQALTRPEGKNSYVGDLFLGLEMQRARNATMFWILPNRVGSSYTEWVPQFTLSYFVRDATSEGQHHKDRSSSFTVEIKTMSEYGPNQRDISVNDVLSSVFYVANTAGGEIVGEKSLWSSERPVLVCTMNPVVYVMTSFRSDLYQHDHAFSNSERALLTLLPALAVADADPHSERDVPAVMLRYRDGQQEIPAVSSSNTPSCMRMSRTGAHCEAYYSTGDRIHCVRAAVNADSSTSLDILQESISFGTLSRPDNTPFAQNITDLFVLEVDGADALVVVRAGTFAKFKAGFPDFGTGAPSMHEHTVPNLEVGTSNILQVSTDGTSVFTVRRSLSVGLLLAVAAWNDESVRNIPLQWDFSHDLTELSPSDVTLAVSPQHMVLIVLRWPGGDNVILFVDVSEETSSSENILKSTFTSQDTPGSAALFRVSTDESACMSVVWLEYAQLTRSSVMLGRNGETCTFRTFDVTEITVRCESSMLQGVLFDRVLNGYLTLDTATVKFDLVARIHAVEINKDRAPGVNQATYCSNTDNQVAAFHVIQHSFNANSFRYVPGPSYSLNGIVHKFGNGMATATLNIDDIGQFPSHVYSTSGNEVSLDNADLLINLHEADDIGYTVIIECICDKLQEQSYVRFGILKFDQSQLQTMCNVEHDTIEIILRVSLSGTSIKAPQTDYWTSIQCTSIDMRSASFLIRARKGVLTPMVNALPYQSTKWLELRHELETVTLQGSKAISIQFNRQYTDEIDELDAHDVIAVDGVELMINLIDPNFRVTQSRNIDTLHTSPAGSTSESDCFCKVGYWGFYDSKCTECAKGTFVTLQATQQCSQAKYMYIPTLEQLNTLDLSVAIGGDVVHGWLRLHVMVGIHIQTDSTSYPKLDCEYRIRIFTMQDTTQNQQIFISALGCSVYLALNGNMDTHNGIYRDCPLEIPYSLVDPINEHVGVDFKCSDERCPLATIEQAMLRPMQSMYSCLMNEFWSQDTRQCVSCEEDNAERSPRCGLGEYEVGCDRLNSDALVRCLPCAWPAGLSESEWTQRAYWGGGVCNLMCNTGYYKVKGLCLPCTVTPDVACSSIAGRKWRACTLTEDGSCVACDAIQKGMYSRNEFYAAAQEGDDTECLSSCHTGFYRSQSSPYACMPCTSVEEMRILVDNFYSASEYYRFQPCTDTSDTVAVKCEDVQKSVILGHADSEGTDCPRACDVGTHAMLETNIQPSVTMYDPAFTSALSSAYTESPTINHTWRMHLCISCGPVLDAAGVVLSAPAYGVDRDCVYTCNNSHAYYDRRDATQRSAGVRLCVYCGRELCAVGHYPAGQECLECRACTPAFEYQGGGWVFVSTGHVDRNMSCDTKCADGMYRDFTICLNHSVLTCDSGYFLQSGTELSDVFCSKCRDCTGRRLVSNCTNATDTVCEDCESAYTNTTRREGFEWIGDNCTATCMTGRVLNQKTGECEQCSYVCPTGSRTAAERHNCSHCEPCAGKPQLAEYTHGCSWTCPSMYVFKNGTNHGRCEPLPSLVQRDVEPQAAEATNAYVCKPGQKLRIESYTAAVCVDCTVVTPANEETWKWNPIGSECAWDCMDPHPYKFYRHTEHVECLTWAEYKETLNPAARRPLKLRSNTWDSLLETTSSVTNIASNAHMTRASQYTISLFYLISFIHISYTQF